MKIIGHRGAAGIALENTLASFKSAQKVGVNAIELDVRKTMDSQLVVCHDEDTNRIAQQNLRINLATYDALQQVVLKDGKSTVPKLSDALNSISKTTVIIDVKDKGCMPTLSKIIDSRQKDKLIVASFNIDELVVLKDLQPSVKTFGLTFLSPFKLIQRAKKLHLDGIGLSFLSLNPLTYSLATKHGLEIYVYTINNMTLAKLIKHIYSEVNICTDRPDKLASLRDKINLV